MSSDPPSSPAAAGETPFAQRLAELREETREVDQAIAGRRFLVVGGTGFLGRYLVEELLARGAKEVRTLCRTPQPDDPERDPRMTFVHGSVADPDVASRACQDIDVVFHSAAHYGTPPFGRLGKGEQVFQINVGGVRNVLAAGREHGVAAMVYTSSVNVIFDGTDRADADEDTSYAPEERLDHYGRSKIQGEKLVLGADGEGLRTCVLRPNGIFGPREDFITDKVLGLARPLRGLPFAINPDQRTDWTFVYNLVWAHLLCVARLREAPDRVGGRAYFITDGDAVHTMKDVVGGFLEALDYGAKPWIPVPTGLMVTGCAMVEWLCHLVRPLAAIDPPFTKLEALKSVVTHTHSTARAADELGYRPLFTTAEGLRHMNDELRARHGYQPRPPGVA